MPVPVAIARRAKFIQWAMVWTQVKKTIDQAMSLWKVMFLSKSMMLLSGVRRRREITPRQTAETVRTCNEILMYVIGSEQRRHAVLTLRL